MAVDSAAKRASAHRVSSWARVLPIPDSTVAAADRAHLLGFYGGLFDAGLVVLVPAPRNILGPDLSHRILGKD